MATTPIRSSNTRHAWHKAHWKQRVVTEAEWRAFLGKWFCDKYPELV